MESLPDTLLSRTHDLAQIVGLVLLLLTLVSAIVVYVTQKELTRRANSREAEIAASNASLKIDLKKTSFELSETKKKLETRTSDRKLTQDQVKQLQRALTGVSGKVLIKGDFADTEAQIFARQIESALKGTNLDIIEQGYTGIVSLHQKGVKMIVKDLGNLPPHAVHLQKALMSIGILAEGGVVSEAVFPDDAVLLWVCHH